MVHAISYVNQDIHKERLQENTKCYFLREQNYKSCLFPLCYELLK